METFNKEVSTDTLGLIKDSGHWLTITDAFEYRETLKLKLVKDWLSKSQRILLTVTEYTIGGETRYMCQAVCDPMYGVFGNNIVIGNCASAYDALDGGIVWAFKLLK